MGQSFGRRGRLVEIALVFVFVILWLTLVTDSRPGQGSLWASVREKVPLRMEIVQDACVNFFVEARNEMTPILSYEDYLGENSFFVPMLRYALQREMFPLQQYSVD